MPRPHHVERRVHRRTPQIAFRVLDFRISTHQPQENSLQHILGVGRIARNPVRGTEHHAVMRFVHLIERFYHCVSEHLPVKTGACLDYYTGGR